MMIKKYFKILFFYILIIPALLTANELIQVEVDYVQGIANVRLAGNNSWISAEPGMILTQGSEIQTGNGGIVDLKFDDKTYVRIGENTTSKIENAMQGQHTNKKLFFSKTQPVRKISLKMDKGSILSKVGKHSAQSEFSVKTPTSVCGVRGTLFSASHSNQTTSVKVLSGIVAVSNISMPDVQAVVMPGQSTSVTGGEAPEPPRQMTPGEVGDVRGMLEGSSPTAAPAQESAAPTSPSQQTATADQPAAPQTEIKSEAPRPVATQPVKQPDAILNTTTTTIIENVVNTVTKPALEKSRLKINVNLK